MFLPLTERLLLTYRFGQCSFDETGLILPLDENSFHIIESRLGLPKKFREVMKVYVSRSFKHTSRDHDGHARTCKPLQRPNRKLSKGAKVSYSDSGCFSRLTTN